MVDSALSNVLKQISKDLQEQNRILKEQNRILRAQQSGRSPSEPVEVPPPSESDLVDLTPVRKVYGWSMAASVQREGGLKEGDIKYEKDSSMWFWTGEIWERVEAPSVG